MNITRKLDEHISAVFDGKSPLVCYAAVTQLYRIGYAISYAVREGNDIATGRKRKLCPFRPSNAYTEKVAWEIAKSLGFDHAKSETAYRRIHRVAQQQYNHRHDAAEQTDADAAKAILFSGDCASLKIGREEARAVALAIAALPPTATASRKSKQEVIAASVYPATNRRSPEKLVWLN